MREMRNAYNILVGNPENKDIGFNCLRMGPCEFL
jgi:hypothetical protein